MKFWLWSDVHLEMQNLSFPAHAPEGVDTILCPGDLCHASDLETYAIWLIEKYDLPIILVPGNHEYYSDTISRERSLTKDRARMQLAAEASKGWKRRLYVLDDSVLEFAGVRIIGGTLWTDFEMGIDALSDIPWRMNEAPSMLADFSKIRVERQETLTPQMMLNLHRQTRDFIKNESALPFNGKTIVMTHHLPHSDCTPAAYRGGNSNFMFACGDRTFDDVLHTSRAPDLWVCGHTHHPFDIRVGHTRILCNPAGYLVAEDERNNGFRWDLTIDTEADWAS